MQNYKTTSAQKCKTWFINLQLFMLKQELLKKV